jgi:hypothetical protein
MALGQTRRRRWWRAARRGGQHPAANFGERARAMWGTSSSSKSTTVLLTCLRNSGRPPRRRNGDGRRLPSGGATRVLEAAAASSRLGFGVERGGTAGQHLYRPGGRPPRCASLRDRARAARTSGRARLRLGSSAGEGMTGGARPSVTAGGSARGWSALGRKLKGCGARGGSELGRQCLLGCAASGARRLG